MTKEIYDKARKVMNATEFRRALQSPEYRRQVIANIGATMNPKTGQAEPNFDAGIVRLRNLFATSPEMIQYTNAQAKLLEAQRQIEESRLDTGIKMARLKLLTQQILKNDMTLPYEQALAQFNYEVMATKGPMMQPLRDFFSQIGGLIEEHRDNPKAFYKAIQANPDLQSAWKLYTQTAEQRLNRKFTWQQIADGFLGFGRGVHGLAPAGLFSPAEIPVPGVYGGQEESELQTQQDEGGVSKEQQEVEDAWLNLGG